MRQAYDYWQDQPGSSSCNVAPPCGRRSVRAYGSRAGHRTRTSVFNLTVWWTTCGQHASTTDTTQPFGIAAGRRRNYVAPSEHPLRGRNVQDCRGHTVPYVHTRPNRRSVWTLVDTRCLLEHPCGHYPAGHLLFRLSSRKSTKDFRNPRRKRTQAVEDTCSGLSHSRPH